MMKTFNTLNLDVEVNARLLQITLDALKMLRAFMVFPHDDLSDFKISTKLTNIYDFILFK